MKIKQYTLYSIQYTYIKRKTKINTAVKERLDRKNYKKWNNKKFRILSNKLYVHKKVGFQDSKREKKRL